MRICSVDGCGEAHYGRGLCSMHWNRLRRHGSVDAPSRTRRKDILAFIDSLPATGDGCIKWPFYLLPNGYARYGKSTASRYICEKFNGPPPTLDYHAAHMCGNGKDGCIAPYHLSWKTASANNEDKKKHGTAQTGERHPSAKLSKKDVTRIRKLGFLLPKAEIARRFKITPQNVSAILSRKTWK